MMCQVMKRRRKEFFLRRCYVGIFITGALVFAGHQMSAAEEEVDSSIRKAFWEMTQRRWAEASDKEKEIFKKNFPAIQALKEQKKRGGKSAEQFFSGRMSSARNKKERSLKGTIAQRRLFYKTRHKSWNKATKQEKMDFLKWQKKILSDEAKRERLLEKEKWKERQNWLKRKRREKKDLNKRNAERLRRKRDKRRQEEARRKKARQRIENARKNMRKLGRNKK